MKKIYYIGHALPSNKVNMGDVLNVAVNNNEIALLQGLNNINEGNVKAFTLIPMMSYPKNNKLYIKKEVLEFDEGFNSTIIPFINFPIIKQISVIVSLFIMLISSIKSDRKDGFKEFKLFNINVHVFFSIPVYVIGKLYNYKTFCFLVDNVVEKRTNSSSKQYLYKIDDFIAKKLFTTYSGILSYSYKSAKEYAPNVPCLEILHIVSDRVLQTETINKESGEEVVISFTGSLTKFNGIKYIIDIMEYLPDNYILNICGDGEMKKYVIEKCNLDHRIIYHGLVSNQDAVNLQRNSNILLLIRSMDNDDEKYLAKYAVSGKLPEYLATGVPVITNDIPAIPSEFRPYLNIIERYDSIYIAQKIIEIVEDTETYNLKLMIGQKAKDYVLENCNWEAQSIKIEQFINSIH